MGTPGNTDRTLREQVYGQVAGSDRALGNFLLVADPEQVWGPVASGRTQGNFLPVADPTQAKGPAVAGLLRDNGRRAVG